jgi:hypothetical protein
MSDARRYVAHRVAPPLIRSVESRLADIAAALPADDREFLAQLLEDLGANARLIALSQTCGHADRRWAETLQAIADEFYSAYPDRAPRAAALADDLRAVPVTGSTATDPSLRREALRRLLELSEGRRHGFRSIWNTLSS